MKIELSKVEKRVTDLQQTLNNYEIAKKLNQNKLNDQVYANVTKEESAEAESLNKMVIDDPKYDGNTN